MQKKKTAVPTYLGVAAVWIGSHFGPGFATGAFSAGTSNTAGSAL